MSTVTSTSSTSGTTTGSTSSTTTSSTDGSDRFLKLLVAQMKNQDPLNPMDNAEVTSQMAQINTVTGIEKLNSSIGAMTSMQGASLVGRNVLAKGSALNVESTGTAQGAFDLGVSATSVKVNVMNSSNTVIDTIDLGKQDKGLHTFTWTPKEGVSTKDVSFSITAESGKTKLTATTYSRDQIDAVSIGSNNVLSLQLKKGGSVPYTSVRSIAS